MVDTPDFCDRCGAANRETAKFCTVCGQSLQGNPPPQASDNLLPSHVLNQRYQILSTIGQGGFGTIYKAEDLTFHHAVRAIKEMRVQHLTPQEKQEAIDSFQREASLLAGLMHPHLPRIYDHFEDHSHWYLIMDFIEGETLEKRLEEAAGHKLPVLQVLQFALQLCNVLNYLHSRQPAIIFRDLKPANVMITHDDHLYLIDFGIARLFKAGQAKDTVALGSPGYAAPEQYGKAQTTERADIYSLGATLHHLLSGRDPGEDPFQFPPLDLDHSSHMNQPLTSLIQSMVDMKRENRPENVQVVKQELLRLSQLPLPISSTQPSAPQTQGSQTTNVPISPQPVTPPTLSQATPSATHITKPSASFYQGGLLCTYLGHKDATEPYHSMTAICWSPDSTHISSISSASVVHVWNAQTGRANLKGTYFHVAWSPDGKRLATGLSAVVFRDAKTGKDQTVHVWRAKCQF